MHKSDTSYKSDLPLPNQDEWEFAQLRELVETRRPRTILEIGTKECGWIYGISGCCASPARFVAVDVRDDCLAQRAAVGQALLAAGQEFRIIIGDSRLPETAHAVRSAFGFCSTPTFSPTQNEPPAATAVDLLHIDGLHTYHACKSDYYTYSPLVRPGGLIVIHDVHHFRDLGVKVFWDELRRGKHGPFARTWEWLHPREVLPNGDGPMGIGVVETCA